MSQRGHPAIVFSEFDIASTAVTREFPDAVQFVSAYLGESASEIGALGRLLAACSNLCYVRLHGETISRLADAISCPLPRLHTLFLSVDGVYPASDAARIFQLSPNLHTILDFPEIDGALPPLPQEPLQLQHMSIIPWRARNPALPHLLSRRWTTRSLDLWVSSGTWDWLAAVDWAGVQPLLELEDLRLLLSVPRRDGPAPALALVTAFPNLRHLHLYASPAELIDMLPEIFRACRSLRRLELDVRDDAPDETARDLEIVAGILRETPPPALRTLRVEILAQARSPGLERLRGACFARRVSCSIKDGG